MGTGLESSALLLRPLLSGKPAARLTEGSGFLLPGRSGGLVILFTGFGPCREAEPGGLAAAHVCMAMSTHPWGKVSADPLQTA